VGIVGRLQLLELGVGRRSIEYRLARGRLRLLHPGVYAVGHEAIPYPGRALAAVMFASSAAPGRRPNAVASNVTAAYLWGPIDEPPFPIHVTGATRRARRRGLVIHRAVLPAEDVDWVDGIPVTSVARTSLDLSATMSPRALRRLIKRAEFAKQVRIDELAAILARYPRRRGRRTLAELVARTGVTAGRTRSDLEDDFVEFCAVRGLPLPETNVKLQIRGKRIEVDCMWREQRVILELDGRDAHARELAFHDDRARDRALIASGWAPMRVTSAQLEFGADELERELRDTLRLRSTRARTNVG
jgi:very-short-patch-repair endonuclease